MVFVRACVVVKIQDHKCETEFSGICALPLDIFFRFASFWYNVRYIYFQLKSGRSEVVNFLLCFRTSKIFAIKYLFIISMLNRFVYYTHLLCLELSIMCRLYRNRPNLSFSQKLSLSFYIFFSFNHLPHS